MFSSLDRRAAKNVVGGNMPRNPVLGGAARVSGRQGASSIACLAFVIFLAATFWAGLAWLVENLLRMTASAF
jgi:hypothetical protein